MNDSALFLQRGKLLRANGQLADALLALLQATRLNRHAVQAQCELGEVWEALGRDENAAKCWQEALRWQHRLPAAHLGLARAATRMRDNERAERHLKTVLATEPGHAEALVAAGEFELARDRPEAALSPLRAAAATPTLSSDLWARLDHALRRAGDAECADRLFARIDTGTATGAQGLAAEIAAVLTPEGAARRGEVFERLSGFAEWNEAALQDVLLALSSSPPDEQSATRWRTLASTYASRLQRIARRGGPALWPRRTRGEALRIALAFEHEVAGVGLMRQLLADSFAPGAVELQVFALGSRELADRDSADSVVPRVFSLGNMAPVQAARLVGELDADLLLACGSMRDGRLHQLLAARVAMLQVGWGLLPPALLDAFIATPDHPSPELLAPDCPAIAVDGDEGAAAMAERLKSLVDAQREARANCSRTAAELAAGWRQALQWHQSGDAERADRVYSQLLDDQPGAAAVHFMRGRLRASQGSLRAAARDYTAALAAAPQFGDAAFALASAQRDLGALPAALGLAQEWQGANPDEARWPKLQGSVQLRAGNFGSALGALRLALSAAPGDADAWFDLGVCARRLGEDAAAIDAFQKAMVLDPKAVEPVFNLAALHQHRGEYDAAAAYYEAAIQLAPKQVSAYKNLGETLFAGGRYAAWIANFRRFEKACPKALALAVCALEVCAYTGDWTRLEQYLDGLRQERFLAASAEELVDGLEELLYLLLFHDVEPELLGKFYRTYAEAAEKVYGPPMPRPKARQEGRLRIGYLSGDVRDHVMGKMLHTILAHHDRQRFEIFLYSTRAASDDWATRIAGAAEHFVALHALDDAAAVARIASDNLDLLVDCSTHTKGARQAILAAKPAAVQMTHIASAGCLGMHTIDYRLTDRYADLPEMQEHQVERLLAMAGCVYPFRHIPAVAENLYQRESLGIAADAFVIGTFVTLLKLSRRCLRLWKEVLERVPSAVIALSPTHAGQREHYLQVFRAAGIDPARLVFLPQGRNESENQARYRIVDAVLDPLPFGGANGSIEALDMGVPVVTLCGRRHGERVGYSILSNLGVTETIAHSGREYVDMACRLATDAAFAAAVREHIRAGIKGSVFSDTAAQVKNLEAAYLVALSDTAQRAAEAAS